MLVRRLLGLLPRFFLTQQKAGNKLFVNPDGIFTQMEGDAARLVNEGNISTETREILKWLEIPKSQIEIFISDGYVRMKMTNGATGRTTLFFQDDIEALLGDRNLVGYVQVSESLRAYPACQRLTELH